MKTFNQKKEEIYEHPDVHGAAKRILRDNADRDVVDVLNDLEMLTELFEGKFREETQK